MTSISQIVPRRASGRGRQSFRMLATALGAAAVLGVGMTFAHAESTLDRINRLIQDLKPPVADKYSDPEYRKNVRRIKFDWGSVIVDYNRSVSLSILFQTDKASLTGTARSQLDELAEALQSPELRDSRYLLAGHTDARASERYNQDLSERRAGSATSYLTAEGGVDGARLLCTAFGETRLKDPNRPASKVNRRVEVGLVVENYPYEPAETWLVPEGANCAAGTGGAAGKEAVAAPDTSRGSDESTSREAPSGGQENASGKTGETEQQGVNTLIND